MKKGTPSRYATNLQGEKEKKKGLNFLGEFKYLWRSPSIGRYMGSNNIKFGGHMEGSSKN